MTIDKYIEDVDKAKIYKIVTDLEGPKHPIDNMDALNHSKDYIVNYLENLGIDVELHSFKVKGFDESFFNILGVIGDPSQPAVVLGSHYDTVRFCPGANDNLSAVAVSLEIARQLVKLENPPTVIIAAFTLEEGHPGVLKYRYECLQAAGLMNEKLKYVSIELLKANKSLHKKVRDLYKQDYKENEVYKILLDKELTKEEKQIAVVLDKVFDVYNPEHLEEAVSLVGSHEYVKKIKKENKLIKSIINFDCLAWIKTEHGTQKRLPITSEMAPFVNEHNMDFENMVGNFIGVAGDKNSFDLVDNYAECCQNPNSNFSHLAMKLPLDHSQLKKLLPDLLRSDHSPFWAVGIPGIFISDFANFRSELYHTPGDQSEYMDYDILEKVTRATIVYLLR